MSDDKIKIVFDSAQFEQFVVMAAAARDSKLTKAFDADNVDEFSVPKTFLEMDLQDTELKVLGRLLKQEHDSLGRFNVTISTANEPKETDAIRKMMESWSKLVCPKPRSLMSYARDMCLCTKKQMRKKRGPGKSRPVAFMCRQQFKNMIPVSMPDIWASPIRPVTIDFAPVIPTDVQPLGIGDV